ncbi:Gfo/Idh/MocA family protein [Virgibacillus doumboii]|uniref:Gfo/Idh/MocA family protein n=1 Tax=Virgibacillus doumboii TaxID=2697503 RepID=UPI0013DE8EED|nr:Gfo/Idh/MocA family oxidoreductase [Virgibacillus doumboii]
MKFGTVGTSWITDAFIGAAEEVNDFTLAAVYSRREDKAKEFADKHGVKHYFTDVEEMANSGEIDCVYLASPNSFHYEHAVTFLKNKKHVICEKPIFSNTKEWEEAYQIAEENNVYLFEAMRNIHSPNFASLKESIKHIGQVRSTSLQLVQYSSRYDKYLNGEQPNIFTAEFSGGALVDLGVYPLSVTVGLFGEPEKAAYYPGMLDSGVDGNGTLILTYDGFTCTILCSKRSNSFNSCEIHGEEGTLIFEGAGEIDNPRLIKTPSKEEVALESVDTDNNMVYEIERFKSIIGSRDDAAYLDLKNQSYTVLSITEKARKQNGIVFGTEKN